MAELVGSIVGITSLGIQVCQGLVSYLRSIEGRHQSLDDGLREVHQLVSILDSLKAILPQLDHRRIRSASHIQTCLTESEKKLLDFQQELLKLRGPPASSAIKGKMKEAGRRLAYPFREGRLTSLHNSLKSLVENVQLAFDVASIESTLAHIARYDIASESTNNKLESIETHMQHVSSQFGEIERTISADLERRLAKTEWHIQNTSQEIMAKVTVAQADVRASTSVGLVTLEAVKEILEKVNPQSVLMTELDMQLSQTSSEPRQANQTYPGWYHADNVQDRLFRQSARSTRIRESMFSMRNNNQAITPNGGGKLYNTTCNCPPASKPSILSYSFATWLLKFQFEQYVPLKHRRGCKYYGIYRKTPRVLRAEFPLMMGFFSARLTLASFDFAIGTSSPGISIRFKNVVPWSRSPVALQISKLVYQISYCRSVQETEQRFFSFERAILSLYQDGESSPNDQTEDGESHSILFIRIFTSIGGFNMSNLSIVTRALKVVKSLSELAQFESEEIDFDVILFLRAHSYDPDKKWRRSCRERMWISYISDSFEIKIGCDPPWIVSYHGNWSLVRYYIHETDFPSLVKAVTSRTLTNLEKCIYSSSPADLTKTAGGASLLQFCATWSEGLQRLLITRAKELIDYSGPTSWAYLLPVALAVRFDCVESVDLLMTTGCSFDNKILSMIRSKRCASIIASHLAGRRRGLLALAQQELQIFSNLSPKSVIDGKAAHLCKELKDANVFVPSYLLVEADYTTIYHYIGLKHPYMRCFFKEGFQDLHLLNSMGLSIPMVWAGHAFLGTVAEELRLLSDIRWLQKQSLLERTSDDPWGLGLNKYATGWHYVGAMMSVNYMESWSQNYEGRTITSILGQGLSSDLSQAKVEDSCICWCNPQGHGCSPLKTLWKTLATPDIHDRPIKLKAYIHSMLHHSFLTDSLGTSSSSPSSDLVRLLTFEALDMTHTCCSLSCLDTEKRCFVESKNNSRYSGDTWVIKASHPEEIQIIRSSIHEKENAQVLESLMEEFTHLMANLGPGLDALEKFIWGHWRRRISEIYIVDPKKIVEMGDFVANLQTGVIPERLSRLLGRGFRLMRFDCEEETKARDPIELSRPCPYCDEKNSRYNSEDLSSNYIDDSSSGDETTGD